jgi:hypothetical protein
MHKMKQFGHGVVFSEHNFTCISLKRSQVSFLGFQGIDKGVDDPQKNNKIIKVCI